MARELILLGDRDPQHVTHRAFDALIEQIARDRRDVSLRWVGTDNANAVSTARAADAVWLASGTPYRNEAAALAVITHARQARQPLLATCGGFQALVVEFARNVAGIQNAAHGETEPDAENQVVNRLACSLYGEERVVTTVPGTRLAAICGAEPFIGFHYCGFGIVDRYVDMLAQKGLTISAHAVDAGVEGVELAEHPFYVGTLFQPQIGALKGEPMHPLVRAFIDHGKPN